MQVFLKFRLSGSLKLAIMTFFFIFEKFYLLLRFILCFSRKMSSSLVGTWSLIESKNYDEFLKDIG
jgi:hypothetical protein